MDTPPTVTIPDRLYRAAVRLVNSTFPGAAPTHGLMGACFVETPAGRILGAGPSFREAYVVAAERLAAR
jgi:hypothetical protein